MISLIEFFLFIGFTIYVFFKTLAYALYEIKQEDNKTGGIMVICFTVISVILVNLSIILIK